MAVPARKDSKATTGRSPQFDGVQVFCASKARDREALGETATLWLRARPDIEIVDKVVTQSSDAEFHCLTITIFYNEKKAAC